MWAKFAPSNSRNPRWYCSESNNSSTALQGAANFSLLRLLILHQPPAVWYLVSISLAACIISKDRSSEERLQTSKVVILVVQKGSGCSLHEKDTVNSFLFREKESPMCQGSWGGTYTSVCGCVLGVTAKCSFLCGGSLWKPSSEEEGLGGLF